MKQRFLYLLRFYAFTIMVFLMAKVFFMYCHRSTNAFVISDVTNVLLHGLSLDLSTSLYLFLIPFLCVLISIWLRHWKPLRVFLKYYYAVIAVALSLAFVADTSLYTFWGFKLDASVFQFVDKTGNAFTSVSAGYLLLRLIFIVLIAAVIYKIYVWLTPRSFSKKRSSAAASLHTPRSTFAKVASTVVMLLCIPLLVIGLRGGLSVSTTNVGQVYYSQKQFLNHAAVNPVFSFLSSLGKTTSDIPEYPFFDDNDCQRQLRDVFFTDSQTTDSLLNTTRPDIVLIVMESCGGAFTVLGGRPEVTPTLTRLSREAISFTNCYANSWRTDRGLVSILSGWPALPKTSIMKMPSKARTLPSLAHSLGQQGYASTFLYGGDIDFTNTRGYLLSTGTQTIVSEDDFTTEERGSSKWGVCDSITFDRLFDIVTTSRSPHSSGSAAVPQQPSLTGQQTFTTLLTLSSHEPWTVPMPTRFDDKILNAFYYLDQCLGRFLNRLRQTPQWENTLVIILPDHGILYEDLDEQHPQRAHIPMFWTGGAIREPRQIDALCCQSDLAATLLGQLNIPHDDYPFSRDILSPHYVKPIAFHTHTEGFSVVDSLGFHAYDLTSQTVVKGKDGSAVNIGKAILQKTAADLRSR